MNASVRQPDIVRESERVARLASEHNIPLRLLGGVAVCLTSGTDAGRPELQREYKDIDFAGPRRAGKNIAALLAGEGYEPNSRFNALHGHSRLLFYDMEHERQVDVFLGTFEMCHKLDLEPRLSGTGATLPISDLLLLKLQIVELNEKDVLDTLTIFLAHEPVSEDRPDTLSLSYIAGFTARDWGWYTTISDNLGAVRARAGEILHDAGDVAAVQRRIDTVLAAMADAPKSMSWKMRDKVGRRKAWYQLPEEVER